MWQTLLTWLVAMIVMILYFPFHIIHVVLNKLFGINLSLSPLPQNISTIEDSPKCFSTFINISTSRGIHYKVHSLFMKNASSKTQRFKTQDIMLVHGAYSDSSTWHGVMPKLASMGYNVHAIDLPGFGKSEFKGNLLELSVDDLADELGLFMYVYMTSMKLNNVIMIGHSFGGFASIMACRHEQCKKMIDRMLLVAPAGIYPIGSRWSHLHAVIFRLKMVSMISYDLQNQGENIIMKFFETGLLGSKWLYPALGPLLSFGKPCRIIGGSQDGIFTVDHGFLLEEITKGYICYDGCPLSDHYINDKSELENYLIHSFQRLIQPMKIGTREPTRRLFLEELAKKISDLDTGDMRVGIESNAFYELFKNYRQKLLKLSDECHEKALQTNQGIKNTTIGGNIMPISSRGKERMAARKRLRRVKTQFSKLNKV